MKKRLFSFVLALLVCWSIAGCVSRDSPLSFAQIFEPQEASEDDVTRAAALAWEKSKGKGSARSACTEALKQLEIESRSTGYDEFRCSSIVSAKMEQAQKELARERVRQEAVRLAKEREQQETDRKAQQEAQERTFNQRIAEIRAGRSAIQTAKEAAVIYGAANGDGLTLQPMIRPDGKIYVLHGRLDPSGGLQGDHFVLRDAAIGFPTYAAILVDERKITLPEHTRVGSSVVVVGSYEANQSFDTLAGARRYMPVFKALFVQVSN